MWICTENASYRHPRLRSNQVLFLAARDHRSHRHRALYPSDAHTGRSDFHENAPPPQAAAAPQARKILRSDQNDGLPPEIEEGGDRGLAHHVDHPSPHRVGAHVFHREHRPAGRVLQHPRRDVVGRHDHDHRRIRRRLSRYAGGKGARRRHRASRHQPFHSPRRHHRGQPMPRRFRRRRRTSRSCVRNAETESRNPFPDLCRGYVFSRGGTR